MEHAPETDFVSILRQRARDLPDRVVLTFLEGEAEEAGSLTYAELDRRASALAARLQQSVSPGDRVLLLYPAGLDYVVAFYACLYARIIAVPLYLPQKRTVPTVAAIAADCGATAALTTERGLQRLSLFAPDSPAADMPWLATDTAAGSAGDVPVESVPAGAIAYLQYTSGSTSAPKGVIVTHGNAVRECAEAAQAWHVDADSRWVSWLPHFHDFGQIGSVMLPVFAGARAVLMAPATFARRPIRWLQAISKYRGTHTGAPNFAYDLCVTTTTEADRAGLDLSSLTTAANGAEPVHLATLERFEQAFTGHGLRAGTQCPSYGLAESTLLVSGKQPGRPQAHGTFAAITPGGPVVEQPGARPLVACGAPVGDTRVAIVDPKTRYRLPDGHAGEVWVAGPIVCPGYWDRPSESADTFGNRIAGEDTGPWLRTGDLGFLHEAELYLCGRSKDLVIVNGVNHYPQDIERTVEESHPDVRTGRCAAIGIGQDTGESVVVVTESVRGSGSTPEEVAQAVRDAVWRAHDLAVTVVVAQTGAVPLTTSGKIQRGRCRTAYLDGTLPVLARAEITAGPAAEPAAAPGMPLASSAAAALVLACRTHIAGWISRRSPHQPAEVDTALGLAAYGFSSVHLLELHQVLEEWSGMALPPELMWECATLDELASRTTRLLVTEGVAR